MKVDLTNEVVFSFDGPNFCLLGDEDDFMKLSKSIVDLTAMSGSQVEILKLDFVTKLGGENEIVFASKTKSKYLGIFRQGILLFELDPAYWERIFKYFVLMSWEKSTYYLNAYENCLSDLDLQQECNFICSSAF
jgi:hypothetical protein